MEGYRDDDAEDLGNGSGPFGIFSILYRYGHCLEHITLDTMTCNRVSFFVSAILVLVSCHSGPSGKILEAQVSAERPNILFIMADDHATKAIGAYGSELAPFIRAMAKFDY